MAQQLVDIGIVANDGTGDPIRNAFDKLNDNDTELYARTPNATHTGDATGDGVLTLATVNADVGSFTNADITVNAKGLITAAASGSGNYVTLTGTQTLTNKRLTLPKINENVTVTATSTELNNTVGSTSSIQNQLNGKQETLVSGTNLKTVGGTSLLGAGNIPIAGTGTVTSVAVTTANGVSGSVADPTGVANITLTLGAITPSSVASTGAVTGTNLSGTNTGDNATNTQYSGLVSNANHTGDATGDTALTVVKINGTLMSGLATGILKNATGTGIPSIASPGTDYVIPSGDITGNAATATKLAATKTINGIAFDGSANITVPSDIAPGALGNVLTSNGVSWTSDVPQLRRYSGVFNLAVGDNPLAHITNITTKPYSVMFVNSSGVYITQDLLVEETTSGGFYAFNIYATNPLVGVEIRITF